MATVKTSLSLRAETCELLAVLSKQTGLSKSVVIDMALMALQARMHAPDGRQGISGKKK